ncbi:GumC family protein [Phreatobacter stygius]|uniref:GumC family protein n=1 Tax=Phreatobacter stygius TaxID=1940610 RepID=UPI0014774F60|nr:AAA family ATPase [Phreatobacter stygius]
MARAEQDLEAYRLVQGVAAAGNPDETGQQIAQLARQLAVAGSEALAVQERLGRIQDLRARGAPTSALAEAIGSAVLADLGRRELSLAGSGQEAGTEQRRNLDLAIRQEIDRSVARLESEARIYRAQTKSIEERLQPLKGAATETAAGMSGLRALERQAAAVVQLFDALLRRQQEANEQVQFVQPDARLLAEAWPPERPSSIHPAFFVPPAVVAFGIMGVLLAFALDRLNRTIRDEDEAVAALGVPCLATMPAVAQWQTMRIQDLLQDEQQAAYARAVRALLVSLLSPNTTGTESKVILVTSSLPGEGKTTLAWSLAILAARFRMRVLLLNLGGQPSALEGEIRAGRNLAVPGVDLAALIAGGGPLSDAVERIPELKVDYIPASRLGGLFHVLAGSRISPWLDQFREAYDLIIVDAPPLADRPEASLLASWADKVLFAVRCKATYRETAQNALRLVSGTAGFDPDGASRVASVLTWVDAESDPWFGAETSAAP